MKAEMRHDMGYAMKMSVMASMENEKKKQIEKSQKKTDKKMS